MCNCEIKISVSRDTEAIKLYAVGTVTLLVSRLGYIWKLPKAKGHKFSYTEPS